jgi:hypothetical protein
MYACLHMHMYICKKKTSSELQPDDGVFNVGCANCSWDTIYTTASVARWYVYFYAKIVFYCHSGVPVHFVIAWYFL